jgi:HupE/UreJ protein
VTIARDGSFSRGLRGVVALGAEHIATGTDHLMFLFALVLVAPLAAEGGRWKSRRGTREALLALARAASAFTVGHSLTLALGALGAVAPPPAAVEAAIAASILVAASHALRPLFPRREALVAGAFGLVHGLAFASSLPGRDLGRAQAAWTLLGFNTGVELAQLGLLFLVAPWLLILARTRAYGAARVGGASAAALLGAAWLLERAAGLPNPTAGAVAWLEAHPVPLLAALALGALAARATESPGPPAARGAGAPPAGPSRPARRAPPPPLGSGQVGDEETGRLVAVAGERGGG